MIRRYRLTVWVDVPLTDATDPNALEEYEYTQVEIERMTIAALRRLEFTSDCEVMDYEDVDE